MVYLPRLADGELSSRLASSGAVLIEGPKACGKIETARRQAASEVRLDVDPRQRAAAEVTPGLILDQPPPFSSMNGNWSPTCGRTCGVQSTTAASADSSSLLAQRCRTTMLPDTPARAASAFCACAPCVLRSLARARRWCR